MVTTFSKKINLSTADLKRQKNIISKLNLKKLPFNLSLNKICDFNLEMAKHTRLALKHQNEKPAFKWCFSSIKRLKVFLIIFEANELGEEIYKEKISSKLPEYSYKTIAQIVDDGIKSNFFIKLEPKKNKKIDLKIRNVRPSEDLIIEFINWKIDLISSLMKFEKA